jgi:hypothetical protein
VSVQSDITSRLQTDGIGTSGTTLFWAVMPDSPNDLVAVYETAGPTGEYTKQGPAGTYTRLQILTRSKSYAAAMTKALAAYSSIDDLRQTIGSTRYHIRALHRPFDVGAQDEAGRTIISCNYEAYLAPA